MEDDWKEFTANIKPLGVKKTKVNNLPEKPRKIIKVQRTQANDMLVFAPTQDLPQNGLSRDILRRMEKGDLKPAILDLHGFTLENAYMAVRNFVKKNYAGNRRLLHIITGRGKGDITIRSEFVRWLQEAEIGPFVSSYQQAPYNMGGDGAWLLYLRKA